MRKCLQIVFLLLLFNTFLYSFELSGKVISVLDGDTIKILTKDKVSHTIRLKDIDAPENAQAFGNKSKKNLSNYIASKTVKVKYTHFDKYKRVLGTVYYRDKNINLAQVKDGFAWVYKKPKNKRYKKEEQKAKEDKKGLWIEKEPIAPWEFRKQKKSTI